MWRLAFYSHLHDRIISLIGRLLSIKLVWPRLVLLKCLYQARKVNGDIFVCWCIYLVSFYTVTYLCVGEYICLFLYGDIFVCWCIYLVSFYTVTYLCVGVYILSLSIILRLDFGTFTTVTSVWCVICFGTFTTVTSVWCVICFWSISIHFFIK
jgi:hypothetical protein